MKKLVLFLINTMLVIYSNAQTFTDVGNISYTYDSVGIGMQNPYSNLSINGGGHNEVIWPIWVQNARNSSTVSGYGVGIKLKHSHSGEMYKWSGIASIQESSWANNSGLALYSDQSEKVRISSNGNVGIGTTDPNDKLHVYDGNIRQTILGSSSQWIYLIQSSSYNSGIWANSGNPALYLRNTSGDLNTIIRPDGKSFLKGGNVGIGTSNPLTPLHLLQTDEKGLRFERSGHDNYEVRLASGDGLNILNASDSRYEMSFDGDGNVGIGTTNPLSNLDVNGLPELDGSDPVSLRISSSRSSSSWIPNADVGSLDFFSSDGSGLGSGVRASIKMITENAIGSRYGLRFLVDNGTNYQEALRINSNTSVGIGTTSTGSHKLAVEGSIGAREIKVEATGWSDFVFENDYSLRTLEEVEQYILENNHLPDIPSEKEVVEGGINLGEMNAKLLQKIEELTLYLIEQNKEIKTLKKEIESLKSE